MLQAAALRVAIAIATLHRSACEQRRAGQYSPLTSQRVPHRAASLHLEVIQELEEIFRKASRDKDHEFLRLLDHELTFRQKNQKTPALRKEVARSLAKVPVVQPDLFNATAPSPTAGRRGPTRQVIRHSRTTARRKPKFKPTDEQDAALQTFLKGHSLKINAFAGSGKTSTLQLLAKASEKCARELT